MKDILAYELHGNCYLNISNRCILRCRFCPKFDGQWDVQNYHLRLSHEPTVDELLQAIGDPERYNEIVFCGLGEPTTRLDVLLNLAEKLRDSSARIRLNTDGLGNLVHYMDITPLLADRVDAISISLNAQSKEVYDLHCRPPHPEAYESLLDFIACSKAHIADVTVTAIDGLEGVDINACRELADHLGVKFRRRVLGQVG